jgi:hypothetical protein
VTKKPGKRRRHRKNALTIRKKHTVSRAPPSEVATDEQNGVSEAVQYTESVNDADTDNWSVTSKLANEENGSVDGEIRIKTKIYRKRKTQEDGVIPNKKMKQAGLRHRNTLEPRAHKKVLHPLVVETDEIASCEASPFQVCPNILSSRP